MIKPWPWPGQSNHLPLAIKMKFLPLESTLVVIESLVLVLALDFEPDTQGFNVHDYVSLLEQPEHF